MKTTWVTAEAIEFFLPYAIHTQQIEAYWCTMAPIVFRPHRWAEKPRELRWELDRFRWSGRFELLDLPRIQARARRGSG